MNQLSLLAVSILGIAAGAPAPRGWTAILAAVDGSSMAGTASVNATPADIPDQPVATAATATSYPAALRVTGAKPRMTLAWSIREGTCAVPGRVVGDFAVTLDAIGAGQATAALLTALTDGKEYAVWVHAGAGSSTPVTACGILVPEASRAQPGR